MFYECDLVPLQIVQGVHLLLFWVLSD
jgi:hypothetical protein